MSLIKKISVVCLGTAFFGAISAANATPMFYNNSTDFNTAATGITLSTNGLDGHPTGSLPSTANGIKISSTNTGSISASPHDASGNAVQMLTASGGTAITFAFSTAINAFAIDVWDLGTQGPTTFTVALSTGGSMAYNLLLASSHGLKSLYGVIDTVEAFTSVTLTNLDFGDLVEFDNVQYGNGPTAVNLPAFPVAEPGTLALFGLGLVGLGFARRRKATV
jgi:hypothetical protein